MEEKTEESKELKIKGQIDYNITKHEDGNWSIDYERSVENEMAAISICQHALEHSIAANQLMLKGLKGKGKRLIKTQSDKYFHAHVGIKMLADNIFMGYEEYKASVEKHKEDMKTAELTDNEKESVIKAMKDVEKGKS